jgi:hypothetical protein
MIARLTQSGRRLTWRELYGLGGAAVVLCRVALGLRRHAFPELLRRLRLYERMPPAEAALVEQATRRVRWAHRLVPVEMNCLVDSLATAALVHRMGFSVPLVIGVQLQGGSLQAHAWVGEAASREAKDFRPLFRIPSEE